MCDPPLPPLLSTSVRRCAEKEMREKEKEEEEEDGKVCTAEPGRAKLTLTIM